MSLVDRANAGVEKDFSLDDRRFLDSLYASQKSQPKNDNERIALLISLMGGGTLPQHFKNKQSERRAYEYIYLSQQGVLR